jgi:hypothetical protein
MRVGKPTPRPTPRAIWSEGLPAGGCDGVSVGWLCVEVVVETAVSVIPVDNVELVREGAETLQEEVGTPCNADVAVHVGVIKEPSLNVSVFYLP